MQVDGSTLPENKCLFLVCVRLMVDDTTYEELEFYQLMETHNKGRFAFENLKKNSEVNKIPLKHLIRIAADSAPSMIGKYRELITYYKELNLDIFTIHYDIHRQHLAAKKLSVCLNDSLSVVIKAVTK